MKQDTNNSNEVKRMQGEWLVTESNYSIQIAKWNEHEKDILCEFPKIHNSDNKETIAKAFNVCNAVNEYDKAKFNATNK